MALHTQVFCCQYHIMLLNPHQLNRILYIYSLSGFNLRFVWIRWAYTLDYFVANS